MNPLAQKPEIQRTRGQNLAVLVKAKAGVPMAEALRLADDAKAVIPSNLRLGTALAASVMRLNLADALTCWSGTMAGYVLPGRTFRQEAEQIPSLGNGYFIVYSDSKTSARYLFPVDEKFLDKKDCLLAVNHPDFALVPDGKDWVVSAALVDLIEKFPHSDGVYKVDPKYGIPTGNEVSAADKTAAPLWRMDKSVGLIIRGCVSIRQDFYRRLVGLYGEPSSAYGVAVESA